MHRGALGPDPRDASAERPPADVDVEADSDRGPPAADRALDQVEVGAIVDHQHRRALRGLARQAPDPGDRPAIDGRVADDQVLEPLLGEVQRLGDREREHAPKARIEVEDPSQHGARAHRLRGDPDRQPAGLLEHPARVAGHRIEVDEGERRHLRGENRVVAGLERFSIDLGRAHGAGERICVADERRDRIYHRARPLERWPSG